MQEKTKKWLLSLAVRTAVAILIFAVVFIVCKIFPPSLKVIRPLWTKSMDIQKIGTLLKEVLKEALP
jgi:hypothetical protein